MECGVESGNTWSNVWMARDMEFMMARPLAEATEDWELGVNGLVWPSVLCGSASVRGGQA